MEAEGQWYVFHVYNKEDKSISFDAKEPIDVARKEELFSANKKILEFFASQNVVQSVYANRNEVLKSIVEMAKAYSDAPQSAQSIMEIANFEIARRFANTCSLFRSFLDHYNRYYFNTHGRGSEKYCNWNASLSREYDGELAYRIVYMMRNYIQHYDMPPLSIGISDSADKPGFETRIHIDLKTLAQDKKIAKKLEKNVDALPDQMSLLVTIDRWSQCFDRIVNEANIVRARDVSIHATTVLQVRKSLNLEGAGRLALMFLPKTDVKPDKFTFNVRYLEESKATALKLSIGNSETAPDGGHNPRSDEHSAASVQTEHQQALDKDPKHDSTSL